MGPLPHDRIERSRVEADVSEPLGVELDTGVGPETLQDHPAERNGSEGVWCVSGGGAASNVYQVGDDELNTTPAEGARRNVPQ